MTHEELLSKIGIQGPNLKAKDNIYVYALRAVVELHRPEEIKLLSGEIEDAYCFECEGLIEYPCPTIQAIEKSLG